MRGLRRLLDHLATEAIRLQTRRWPPRMPRTVTPAAGTKVCRSLCRPRGQQPGDANGQGVGGAT
jgi:hypothetical protein